MHDGEHPFNQSKGQIMKQNRLTTLLAAGAVSAIALTSAFAQTSSSTTTTTAPAVTSSSSTTTSTSTIDGTGTITTYTPGSRSEERRVGKAGRDRCEAEAEITI